MKKIQYILIIMIFIISCGQDKTNFIQLNFLELNFRLVCKDKVEFCDKVKISENPEHFIFLELKSFISSSNILEFLVDYNKNILVIKLSNEAKRDLKHIIKALKGREICVLLGEEVLGFIKINDIKIKFNKIILPITDLDKKMDKYWKNN